MTVEDAISFAKSKIVEFNLNYEVELMPRRKKFSVAGRCDYRKKIIELQPNFILWNSDYEVIETILHEVAHALMPRHGHNKFWKRKLLEIGGNGKRCYGSHIINSELKLSLNNV